MTDGPDAHSDAHDAHDAPRRDAPAEAFLDAILDGFPYEAGRLNARLVRTGGGREVILIRVELGILQMECAGRPDGRAGILERLESARGGPHDAAEGMPSSEAAALRLELVQFHQRAVAFLALGDPARALADAERLLRGTSLLADRGPEPEADWAEGARFSAIVLRTRSAAAVLATAGRAREAGAVVEAGIEMLRAAAARSGIDAGFEALGDVAALRALRESLVPQLPPSLRSELEARLRAAILNENFELAAILRDELRLL